jgi:hypothetical protein
MRDERMKGTYCHFVIPHPFRITRGCGTSACKRGCG